MPTRYRLPVVVAWRLSGTEQPVTCRAAHPWADSLGSGDVTSLGPPLQPRGEPHAWSHRRPRPRRLRRRIRVRGSDPRARERRPHGARPAEPVARRRLRRQRRQRRGQGHRRPGRAGRAFLRRRRDHPGVRRPGERDRPGLSRGVRAGGGRELRERAAAVPAASARQDGRPDPLRRARRRGRS